MLWSAVISQAYGQVRMVANDRAVLAVGLDMGSLLAMAGAAGVSPVLALDVLTALEPTILQQINDRSSSPDD